MADDSYGIDIPADQALSDANKHLSDSNKADSEAGQAGMPNDPNAPDDGLKSQSLSGDDEYTQQLKKQHKDDVDRADRYSQEQQHYIDHFQKSAANTQAPPQLQQVPPMPQEAKGTAAQTVFNVLAVAATAFALFGSRRNPYSQGALMSGLGAIFKGVAEGRQAKVKEDSVKWHQHNESIQAENKARLQDYKDILANKKLDLGQQMDLIRMKANFHKDLRLEGEASEKNLAKIQKNLQDKQKQLKDHALKTTKGTVTKNSTMIEDYRQRALEKTKGKVDYNEDPQAAREAYPWSQFLKDSHRDEEKDSEKRSDIKLKQETKDAGGVIDSADPLDLGLVRPKMETKTQESVLGGGSGAF